MSLRRNVFKIGDTVKYIGNVPAQIVADEMLYDWCPPYQSEEIYVVTGVRLADENDCRLKPGHEVYKIYIRIPYQSNGYVIHTTDMYWDFELVVV